MQIKLPYLDTFFVVGGFLTPQTVHEFVVVKTAYGIVRGKIEPYLGQKNKILKKSVYKFEGIPYAQPPIGLLRFKVFTA